MQKHILNARCDANVLQYIAASSGAITVFSSFGMGWVDVRDLKAAKKR